MIVNRSGAVGLYYKQMYNSYTLQYSFFFHIWPQHLVENNKMYFCVNQCAFVGNKN